MQDWPMRVMKYKCARGFCFVCMALALSCIVGFSLHLSLAFEWAMGSQSGTKVAWEFFLKSARGLSFFSPPRLPFFVWAVDIGQESTSHKDFKLSTLALCVWRSLQKPSFGLVVAGRSSSIIQQRPGRVCVGSSERSTVPGLLVNSTRRTSGHTSSRRA